ncbi:Testis-expressed protein 47 [Lamellibrachia satsuma]|nr:Testis-expressed protein 47 [Lamellibrachia satsuma]
MKPQRNSTFTVHAEMTLLDVVEETNKGAAILHRIYIVSKLAHQDLNEIGKYFTKYFKDLQTRLLTPAISGLLLIYPSHCVHVVESENSCLVELVKMLVREEDNDKGHVQKSKVLLFSHTIGRLYRQYNYRIVDHEVHQTWSSDESYDQMVLEIVLQLQKLGHYITTNSRSSKMSFRTLMDTMHYRVPQLLPEQGMIAFLIEEDNPLVMTVTDWTKLYYGDHPFDTEISTDKTWPQTETCVVMFDGKPTHTEHVVIQVEDSNAVSETSSPRTSLT